MNLLKNTSPVRHSNAVAAGATVITPSDGVDMAGYEGCMFLVEFGAITAAGVQSIEVHGSDDDVTYNALAGTNVAVADDDDDKIAIVDVYRPLQRYLKCVVNRATQNSVIEGITAVRYGARKSPPALDATVVAGSEQHASPAVGTA